MSIDLAESGIVAVPEEVANATLETHARKDIRRAEIVVNRAQPVISEHGLSELIQALSARKPTRGNNHGQESRVQFLCLFNEQVVDRASALSKTSIAQLVRGIANYDVELHIEDLLRLVGVNKSVGVTFEFAAPFVVLLAGSAVRTTAILPCMLHSPESDVAFRVIEGFAHGILPVSGLGTVQGPPRE